MLRAFAFFLLIFFLLSLVVHLDRIGSLFGAASLSLFALDLLIQEFGKTSRHAGLPEEPLR